MKTAFSRPLLAGVLSVVLSTAVAADDDKDFSQLDAWLSSVETLHGDFSQQLLNARGETLSESTGTLHLSRPGLFRWHYDKPAELLVIGDGEQVYNYDVELESVTIMPQGDALSGSPVALLAGTGSLADGFDYAGGWEAAGVRWSELVPHGEERDFRLIRLALENDRLVAMELHDQLGQVTRIEFDGLEHNVPVGEMVFEFEIPDDVDVILSGESAP
ncbi:MAG: outer membrane lipoprotein chaperone LolA [Gammaproteobacteria bacterium]|nr:outer membrane lipoprotein chaperone LolA [Gammaproteobacteria bacterium]